ncbi:MAG: 2-amino-4-hydroxy-6-hydroxymethyldihydropteridine diphosphokinase [Muribaculaceae bacterium]|nr:2-amino-4-hydroxy-6-hydroxymethyldihydropteridine diphosphokinase [Muribaculaceae bacterium]
MIYYLNIGSNLDDREGNLWAADLRLSLDLGFVIARSSIVESEPWGFDSDNAFLNMGIAVDSRFTPIEALNIIHDIEHELNRGHSHRDSEGNYVDRLVDIDIMAIDDLVIDLPSLQVPHHHMPNRDFFLKPMAELAPSWEHPILNLTAQEMLHKLSSDNGVQ